jgi:hypothetical protein
MKRFFLIIVSTLIVLNLNAQKYTETNYPKLFQKLVLDIGAVPLSVPVNDNVRMSAYNFSLGYQFTKSLDIRLNADVFHQYKYMPHIFYLYHRILGLSLGANFNAFKGKSGSFLEKTSLGFVGKFGVGVAPEMEQESIFYDFSARTYFGNIPYVSLGINHQFYDSSYRSNLVSLYVSFGLDF